MVWVHEVTGSNPVVLIMNKSKLKLRVRIVRATKIKAWGAYLAGSLGDGTPIIALNIDACLHALVRKDVTHEEFCRMVGETVAHEVAHLIEDWCGVKFSERRVNAIIAASRKQWEKERKAKKSRRAT